MNKKIISGRIGSDRSGIQVFKGSLPLSLFGFTVRIATVHSYSSAFLCFIRAELFSMSFTHFKLRNKLGAENVPNNFTLRIRASQRKCVIKDA